MSVKKLSFYLDSARITVRSDHLPLKRFLEKNTLNAKVDNWAVELESQKIDFVFIQGTKNVLADTLSRLIEIDDDIKLPAEQEGHEFGYVPFEQLPPAQVTVTEEVIINEVNNLTRSPGALCRAVFVFLCILNVVVIFYYIFINVQLLWLLHSIGPSP